MTISNTVIPSPSDLLCIHSVITAICAIIILVPATRTKSSVAAFQISMFAILFLLSTPLRPYYIHLFPLFLRSILQPVVLFYPPAVGIVILSSVEGTSDWVKGLMDFRTRSNYSALISGDWGAGDFITFLLGPAIVTLAFSSVEVILKYHKSMLVLTPVIWVASVLLAFLGAAMARMLQTDDRVGLPLITHNTNTGVGIAIANLGNYDESIAAATCIVNTCFSFATGARFLLSTDSLATYTTRSPLTHHSHTTHSPLSHH